MGEKNLKYPLFSRYKPPGYPSPPSLIFCFSTLGQKNLPLGHNTHFPGHFCKILQNPQKFSQNTRPEPLPKSYRTLRTNSGHSELGLVPQDRAPPGQITPFFHTFLLFRPKFKYFTPNTSFFTSNTCSKPSQNFTPPLPHIP